MAISFTPVATPSAIGFGRFHLPVVSFFALLDSFPQGLRRPSVDVPEILAYRPIQ